MKKRIFLKTVCCMLVFLLLSGCAPKSPLLAHTDDIIALNKMPVSFGMTGYSSLKNTEGKELRWFANSDQPFSEVADPTSIVYETEGDMEYKVTSQSERLICYELPFSKAFTVYSIYHYFPEDVAARNKVLQEEVLEKVRAEASIEFSGVSTIYQSIFGDWEKIVFHCNNVTELYGDLDKFEANIKVDSVLLEDKKLKKKTDRYILEGSGRDHVILALVDGRLLTEGMEGNYTVTHKIYTDWEKDKDVTVKEEYDQDGNLLSTTEE